MKTSIRIFMLLMLTAGLSSCEMIKGWTEVDIDTTLEAELDILTDDTDLKSTDAFGFNKSTTIQVINADLVDYEDLINAIKAKSVVIEVGVIESSGEPITGVKFLKDTKFGISNPNTEFVWTLKNDLAIETDDIINLPADSYSVLNEILNDYKDYPVTVSAIGECNLGNVYIELNYGIEITVTSSPL